MRLDEHIPIRYGAEVRVVRLMHVSLAKIDRVNRDPADHDGKEDWKQNEQEAHCSIVINWCLFDNRFAI